MKGVYALVVKLCGDSTIAAGKLNSIKFRKGFYVYSERKRKYTGILTTSRITRTLMLLSRHTPKQKSGKH